ncbi:MAG: polyketide cyclase [Anaerolineaceae bacterium]|nr:polyketide cyclase [Anaerolineaceae bacterium]
MAPASGYMRVRMVRAGVRAKHCLPANANHAAMFSCSRSKGPEMPNDEVVRALWKALDEQDFDLVREVLHADFVCEWPQSRERIRGPENYIAINQHYPGVWRIYVLKVVAGEDEVVSEVEVELTSDNGAVRQDRAVSFFKLREGKIVYLREYWPEPFAAPDWRSQWVEKM